MNPIWQVKFWVRMVSWAWQAGFLAGKMAVRQKDRRDYAD